MKTYDEEYIRNNYSIGENTEIIFVDNAKEALTSAHLGREMAILCPVEDIGYSIVLERHLAKTLSEKKKLIIICAPDAKDQIEALHKHQISEIIMKEEMAKRTSIINARIPAVEYQEMFPKETRHPNRFNPQNWKKGRSR